jgi:hypothetical protein
VDERRGWRGWTRPAGRVSEGGTVLAGESIEGRQGSVNARWEFEVLGCGSHVGADEGTEEDTRENERVGVVETCETRYSPVTQTIAPTAAGVRAGSVFAKAKTKERNEGIAKQGPRKEAQGRTRRSALIRLSTL